MVQCEKGIDVHHACRTLPANVVVAGVIFNILVGVFLLLYYLFSGTMRKEEQVLQKS